MTSHALTPSTGPQPAIRSRCPSSISFRSRAGRPPRQAIANTIDLAKRAEAAGYRRYWFAEHHLNPGVAGTTPALLIALIANATRTLRVGSGAVLMGHHTPLAVVEQFGILDAVHPGRIDLGLGRSGFKRLQQRTGDKATDQSATGAPTTRPHRAVGAPTTAC